jgi:hypothetical protein
LIYLNTLIPEFSRIDKDQRSVLSVQMTELTRMVRMVQMTELTRMVLLIFSVCFWPNSADGTQDSILPV